MSFVKKTWKDRISQFPNRRTINDGYVTKQVTVGRDEGAVTEEGTPFDATEMNDLENRIYAAIEGGGGGGGGAGTYDYTELFNKPRINNHELNDNQSAADLGIASNANELPIESGSATTTKDYIDDGLDEKADTSDLSDVATSGDYNDLINKPITFGGIISDLNVERVANTFRLYLFNGGSANAPSGTAGGWLIHMVNDNTRNYGSQIASTDGGLYFRKITGGTYQAWITLTT